MAASEATFITFSDNKHLNYELVPQLEVRQPVFASNVETEELPRQTISLRAVSRVGCAEITKRGVTEGTVATTVMSPACCLLPSHVHIRWTQDY